MQFVKLISYGDNTIMISNMDSYFQAEWEFTTDDGLMMAFGLTAYDYEEYSIEDLDYGELKAFYKYWNNDSDGPEFIEIPTT